jgi:phenylacetate-coenzyme A ligase PaaK-like adenylate-forming protein
VRLPAPRFVPVWSPLEIVDWMADVLEEGGTPHLYAYTSTGVSLCRAATEAGRQLTGAKLTLTGEPITDTRMSTVRAAGAEATTNYGSNEAGGFIGYGCLEPEVPDEVHLHHDLHAIIQADQQQARASLPEEALLITSIRKTTPIMLLNVSMGDRAKLVRRDCGCGLERVGWSTHLHTIRSFEKLTAGGITFFDTDVIRVLEEVLPNRFGGGPTDYQLVEEEMLTGNPRLRLLVDPSVGPVDEMAVADAFLDAIGAGSGGPRVAELVWREARLLRVERREPERTRSGKILHLHVRTGEAQTRASHDV